MTKRHAHPVSSTAAQRTLAQLPRLLALLVLLLSAVGCSHVEPWERGVLAKPHMALQPPALLHGVRKHTYGSREAIAGTDASSGGGCGCY